MEVAELRVSVQMLQEELVLARRRNRQRRDQKRSRAVRQQRSVERSQTSPTGMYESISHRDDADSGNDSAGPGISEEADTSDVRSPNVDESARDALINSWASSASDRVVALPPVTPGTEPGERRSSTKHKRVRAIAELARCRCWLE